MTRDLPSDALVLLVSSSLLVILLFYIPICILRPPDGKDLYICAVAKFRLAIEFDKLMPKWCNELWSGLDDSTECAFLDCAIDSIVPSLCKKKPFGTRCFRYAC